MKEKKIAIIGCGNLGLSIVHGLMAGNTIPPSNIYVTKRHLETLKEIKNSGVKMTSDNGQAIRESDIILVALKPYNILDVLIGIKQHFDPKRHVLVSMATGISMEQIKNTIEAPIPLFRAMPNTAADVGESLTCICSNSPGQENFETVQYIFDSIGSTIVIEEDLMEAATTLGACGIAYVLRFIRAMVQGGIEIGFDAKTTSAIVNQTVKGASELLIKRKKHPEFEIDKVTTPKGCTIVGLNEMEHNGFSSSLIKGIVTSFEKIE